MILFTFAFLFGDLYFQTFSHLPNPIFVGIILFFTTSLWQIFKNKLRFVYLLPAFFLGLAWTHWYAASTLAWTLPKPQEGKPILITGYIYSLPISHLYGTQFEFKSTTINHTPTSTLLRLTTTEFLPLKVGDKWQFLAKLKRIHSTQNIASFDQEAWALQKGLRASGTIMHSNENILLEHHRWHYPIARLRLYIHEQIHQHFPNAKTLPWLTALMIGDRSGAMQNEWQVLRDTGTNHLMVIGGLHIGMIAGFSYLVISWLWRRSAFLSLKIPAQHIAACGALTVAIIYGALSGFLIPTQRACAMLCISVFSILLNRRLNAWYLWSLALLSVLIINPLSVLTESFWLSFATIALIIYGMHGRLYPSGLWWRWGRVQWVIGVGLIPISLVLFQECSLISFVANSIAIPWLGMFILPLCVIADCALLISTTVGVWILSIADKMLSGLWLFLSWLAQLQFASFHLAISSYTILICSIVGIILLLLPAGMAGRWFGLIWLSTVLFAKPAEIQKGNFTLSLLDVGQGLSVVIQTQKHLLVYDTGPKYDAAVDMGERVVVPYLRHLKVKSIDMLVVSHGDNDHIGGASTLMHAFDILNIKTSAPHLLASNHTQFCKAGEHWEWDGVKFIFLYPYTLDSSDKNNHSCVLLINNGKHRVLLPGDIEKLAEKELLTLQADQLHADILVAPHHGSKTSGLPAFIDAVNPKIVLYAVGYRNRYHFPHPMVMKTYEQRGTKAFDTAEDGLMIFNVTQSNTIEQPFLYRIHQRKYWFS